MSDSKQRKSGVLLSYISIGLNILIQLLYTPLLIRMLGQSEYGIYSLVSSLIAYLTILDFGFGNAIIIYTAKYNSQKKYAEEKKLHGMFSVIYKIIALLVFIIGIILYFFVDDIFASGMTSFEIEKMKVMMIILTFNLIVSFLFSIYSSIIIANERFVFQKIIAILTSVLKPLIMIPLLLLGFKSITLTIVITLVNLFSFVSNYIYVRKKLKIEIKYSGFDKEIFKEIVKYSLFIFLCNIVDQVNNNVDQLILGALCGTAAVSIYSIAMHLYHLFFQLSIAINQVFLPKITKMIAKGISNLELTKQFIRVGRIQFYIIFLICTGIILFGKEFIMWWAGPDFYQSYYVTLLLVIPASVPLIQNTGLSIMQAMNKYKFKAYSTFIMAIVNIIISIFLTMKYGVIGAAMGTTIAICICNIFLINIYYYKEIKIDIIDFWKQILIMILKFSIPIIAIIIITKLTSFTGIISVIIYGSIYTVLYCIIAYVIVMNDYEKKLVNSILKKILIKG